MIAHMLRHLHVLCCALAVMVALTTVSPGAEDTPVTDESFFASLDLGRADLARVRAAADAADWAAARAAFVEHLKSRTGPHWHFDWRDRSAPDHRASEQELVDAERYVRNELLSVSVWHDFGDHLDWNANPMLNQYAEWTWQLNRHKFWETLGKAYWTTGDERYAEAFVRQMTHWVSSQPRPEHNGNRRYSSWRTIETGIRSFSSWPNAFFYFLSSPSFNDEAVIAMVKSFGEHARHLMAHPQTANWLTMECNGLYHIGTLFPEFKESMEWRRTAIDRLYGELDKQVYPDGAQIELSTSYHVVALNSFEMPVRLAKLNDQELPKNYLDRLQRMFDFVMLISMPNRYLPPLNDSGHVQIQPWLRKAASHYPGREDYRWIATEGREGTPPLERSHAFPYAGYLVMRSGWDRDARYLLLDAGPFGYGHQHEDKLSIVVAAYGRVHLIDPGMYHYDESPQRRYHLDTFAHNTVLVDGLPQRRRGEKDRWTYVVAEPLPHGFTVTDAYEYASGTYDEGYGDEKRRLATHHREVVYVKAGAHARSAGDYWIVVDTLVPNDDQPHTYDAMFHLDADAIAITDDLRVVTVNGSGSNFAIIPLPDERMSLTDQMGQTEPFVQGWVWQGAYDVKAIPTPVYRTEAIGRKQMVFVLYPLREGERLPVHGLARSSHDVEHPLTLEITFQSGSADVLIFTGDPKQPVTIRSHPRK
jgi:hypothetical protein